MIATFNKMTDCWVTTTLSPTKDHEDILDHCKLQTNSSHDHILDECNLLHSTRLWWHWRERPQKEETPPLPPPPQWQQEPFTLKNPLGIGQRHYNTLCIRCPLTGYGSLLHEVAVLGIGILSRFLGTLISLSFIVKCRLHIRAFNRL